MISDNQFMQQNCKQKKLDNKLSSGQKIMRFKYFIQDVEYLKKTQIKLRGLDNKLVSELGANKCTGQEFLNYYPTFLVKFAEKCQKKWSKKDKCMLLWVIVRFIQLKGQKSIEDLSQENYDDLQEILGIKKQVIIQQISQIICLKTSKNPFSVEEKNKLIELIREYEGKTINWCSVAQQFNNSFEGQQTLRTIKALKQVYINHLNPLLNKSCWQSQEDVKLISIIQRLGKKWQQAANIMKTRNQCQVKNQYYKLLREQMHKEKIPSQKKLDLQQELQILEVYKQQIMAQENIQEIDLDFKAQQLPSHIVAPIINSEHGSNIVSIKMDDISLSLTNSQHLQDYQKIQTNNEVSNQSVTQNCHQQNQQELENYNLKYQKYNEFQQQQSQIQQQNKQYQNQEQQLLGQNNYNNYSENIQQIQQENIKYDQYSSEYQDLETQANIESILGSENIQLYPQSDQNIDISNQLNKEQSFLSAQQSPQNKYNIMYNGNSNNVDIQQQSFIQDCKYEYFMENNNQDYYYDFNCYQDNQGLRIGQIFQQTEDEYKRFLKEGQKLPEFDRNQFAYWRGYLMSTQNLQNIFEFEGKILEYQQYIQQLRQWEEQELLQIYQQNSVQQKNNQLNPQQNHIYLDQQMGHQFNRIQNHSQQSNLSTVMEVSTKQEESCAIDLIKSMEQKQCDFNIEKYAKHQSAIEEDEHEHDHSDDNMQENVGDEKSNQILQSTNISEQYQQNQEKLNKEIKQKQFKHHYHRDQKGLVLPQSQQIQLHPNQKQLQNQTGPINSGLQNQNNKIQNKSVNSPNDQQNKKGACEIF